MADVDSSEPTPNDTTGDAGNNNTNASTTSSADNFLVDGIGKYGDAPAGGDNQTPESTGQSRGSSGATPI